MDKEKYEEAKIYQREIHHLLKEGNLSPEEKQNLEQINAQLTGILMSPWLPLDWGRKWIMIFIFVIGIIGIIQGQMLAALLWLLLPLFSPRLLGEIFILIGRFSKH